MPEPLRFVDHHRQSYAHLPLRDEWSVAEFSVSGDGGRGEFMISLKDLHRGGLIQQPRQPLAVYLQVFDDGFGALRECIAAGVLDLIEKTDIWCAADLTTLLVGAGLTDRSEVPV